MRWLSLLTLLGASCSILAGSSVSAGDGYFRREDYGRALLEYQDAWDAGARGDELAERLLEARYRVVADHARQLLHRNQPRQAYEVMQVADRIRPGHPWTAELERRSRRKMAETLSEQGAHFLRADQPREALEAYTSAVAWDDSFDPAREGFATAQAQSDARFAKGERLFLLGLEEENAGHDLRALTALNAAESLWGPGSRAAGHLEQIRHSLAEESRRSGEAYLRAGLVGPAWVAFRDAHRLLPEDAAVGRLVEDLEHRLAARAALGAADHAIRAGALEAAERKIAEAVGHGGAEVSFQAESLRSQLVRTRNAQRYALARALESDQQTVRAVNLYRAILNEGGDGLEDVQGRLDLNLERLAEAETAYRKAQEALAAGDKARAREKFAETVRLARDFQDALEQLRRLE